MTLSDDDIRAVQMETAQLDREAARCRLYAAKVDEDFASERMLDRLKARSAGTPMPAYKTSELDLSSPLHGVRFDGETVKQDSSGELSARGV